MIRIVKKPHIRKQEIVEMAQHLFQQQKYEKTSMQDIVDQLGIAKGTIYHYFTSKEELLEAVVNNMVDEDIERKTLLIEKTDGNALDKFKALVALNTMAEEYNTILKHLHQPSNMGLHAQLLAVMIIKEAPLYAQVITQGCHEGLFNTDNPLECAEFMLSGIQFLTDIGIYPWASKDLARRARAFPAMVEGLLQAQPGSFVFLVGT